MFKISENMFYIKLKLRILMYINSIINDLSRMKLFRIKHNQFDIR